MRCVAGRCVFAVLPIAAVDDLPVLVGGMPHLGTVPSAAAPALDFAAPLFSASVGSPANTAAAVYDNGNIIVPDDEIEPTCISDVDDERFRVQLWKMKELLETQVKKEKFWEIDEDFLLEIGTCIGELMFAKLKVMSEHF